MSAIAGMSQNSILNVNEKISTPFVIVITGGIATGKSAVTSYLRSKGYKVFDSDEIVHRGYETQSELFHSVVNHFGKEIVNENGIIDRKKLSDIVLSDEFLLEELNELVHKYVVDELMSGVKKTNDKNVFLDIPLMFEHKEILEKLGLKYDQIWLVYVSAKTQKERLINRAKFEKKNIKQVLKILDMQIPIDKKISMSDVIIHNEGTLDELHQAIDNIINLN